MAGNAEKGRTSTVGQIVTDPNVKLGGGTSVTSLSLLERACKRDPDAWVRLTELYGPLLDQWCSRAGLQQADAADVKQEVFAAVLNGIGGFRHDRPGDTFRGWLYAVTRNKIRDRARRGEAQGPGGTDAQIRIASLPANELEEELPADPDSERAQYLRAIELVRGEFEPKTWDAFLRVTVDGRNAADVALELGMSPNAVYLARSRIFRRLREEFDGLIPLDTGETTSTAPAKGN